MRNKNRNFRWYRRMRTTAERRANQDNPYARSKRKGKNLPDPWDDHGSCHQKTWKVKRDTQYHPNGRGQYHEYIVEAEHWGPQRWNFIQYCEAHDIAHEVECIYEPYLSTYYQYTKRVKVRERLHYQRVWNSKLLRFEDDYSHPIGYRWEYGWVHLDKPIVHRRMTKRIVGHRLIWWSDRDIGIEYIVNKEGYA